MWDILEMFSYHWFEICVPAWHNEAEVGNLASEILMKVVKLAKFMTFFYLSIFSSFGSV